MACGKSKMTGGTGNEARGTNYRSISDNVWPIFSRATSVPFFAALAVVENIFTVCNWIRHTAAVAAATCAGGFFAFASHEAGASA